MDITRREFVAGCAVAAACLTCANFSASTADAAVTAALIDAGEVANIKEGITDTLASSKVLIVRAQGKIFAESAICTHRTTTLKVVDGELRCPSHGSRFDIMGNVTKGPAKEGLPRFAVSIKDGHLFVDTSKVFKTGSFDQDGAFVKAP